MLILKTLLINLLINFKILMMTIKIWKDKMMFLNLINIPITTKFLIQMISYNKK